MVKVWLHSTGDASPGAALLLPQVLPIFCRPPSFAPENEVRELQRDLAVALAEAGRALPAGRLARLGATPDFHHGLLVHSRFHNHVVAGFSLMPFGNSDPPAAARAISLGKPLRRPEKRPYGGWSGAPLRHPTGISAPSERFSVYRSSGLLRRFSSQNSPICCFSAKPRISERH